MSFDQPIKKENLLESQAQSDKDFSDDILKRVGLIFNERGIKVVKRTISNLKMANEFGQNWNVGKLESLNNLQVIANRKENFDLIEEVYNTLLSLNPELKNISLPINNDKYAIGYETPVKSAKLDIVRGVASGLHFNDIKYFVEILKGDAKNENFFHKIKQSKSYNHYKKIHNGETIEFALSPETIKRILNNQPYFKKDTE